MNVFRMKGWSPWAAGALIGLLSVFAFLTAALRAGGHFVAADLATQRGPEALGATIPRGIAIETRRPELVPCVFAHEVLHFLGIHHVDEQDDLMHPRCQEDKPEAATLSDAARDEIDRLESIRAITLGGTRTWAERL